VGARPARERATHPADQDFAGALPEVPPVLALAAAGFFAAAFAVPGFFALGFAAFGFAAGFDADAAGFDADAAGFDGAEAEVFAAVRGVGFERVGAVAERGAPAEPAGGAPVAAGDPDTPPRLAGAGRVPVAAAFVRAVLVARGAPAPVFAPPARVAGGVLAAGVAGVTGAAVTVSSSWRRRRPARSAPVCAATLPIPTTESMMSFGLMAMRTVCPRGARTTRR
jgi:hypothetical protein